MDPILAAVFFTSIAAAWLLYVTITDPNHF